MTLPSLEELADRAGELDPRFLSLALAFQLVNLGLRGLAWRNVLAAAYRGRHVPVVSVVAAYAAGVALNAVMPARGGEAAKVLLVRTRIPGSSVATIAASSSVLLILDTVLGIALVSGAAALGVLPTPPLPSVPWPALLALVPLLAIAAVLARRFAPRLRGVGHQLRQGVAILGTPGAYLRRVAAPQAAPGCAASASPPRCSQRSGSPRRSPPPRSSSSPAASRRRCPRPAASARNRPSSWSRSTVVSASGAFSFSVALQLLVTAVNATIGIAAMMLLVRTLRPVAAVRAGFAAARTRPS